MARANPPALAIHDDRLLTTALVSVYDELHTKVDSASAAPTAPSSPPPIL